VHTRPILVTGAAGFIGSHVVTALIAQGHRVVGVDNFDLFYDPERKHKNINEACAVAAMGPHGQGGFELIDADVADAAAMNRAFTRKRPIGVIHLAAKAGVRPSIEHPAEYSRTNVQGTAVILEAAAKVACARVVLASSSSVYGNNTKVPFAETDAVDAPISPYAATKRANELQGYTHWHLTKMPTAMLRFFTVYGPRQRPDLAIQTFLAKVSRGETLRVFGDGTSSRDYTFIDDIVRGVIAAYHAIDKHGYRVWNLGGKQPISLKDLIAAVGTVTGKTPKVEHQPMQAGDVEKTWADLTRSRAELGYEPNTDFVDGLRRQYEWMKQHHEA
jgi:UDP-glucuronate 4-epimerase